MHSSLLNSRSPNRSMRRKPLISIRMKLPSPKRLEAMKEETQLENLLEARARREIATIELAQKIKDRDSALLAEAMATLLLLRHSQLRLSKKCARPSPRKGQLGLIASISRLSALSNLLGRRRFWLQIARRLSLQKGQGRYYFSLLSEEN